MGRTPKEKRKKKDSQQFPTNAQFGNNSQERDVTFFSLLPKIHGMMMMMIMMITVPSLNEGAGGCFYCSKACAYPGNEVNHGVNFHS